MTKKSRPESEQCVVENQIESKKRKKKSSDTEKATVIKPGRKEESKAGKLKKRKRESVDTPAPEGADEGELQHSKAEKIEKKKKQKKKAERESGGGTAGSDAVVAQPDVVAVDGSEEPSKKKKKKKKSAKAPPGPPDDTAGNPTKGEKKSKKRKCKGAAEKTVHVIGTIDGPTATVQEVVEPATAAQAPPAVSGHSDQEAICNGAPMVQPKGVKNSFRRVKSEEWVGRRGSMDNTYEGTFGASGWGFKAQQVLGQVRGKDFRHEKTKKKRGSYMGGKIDSSARFSFKYDSD